VGAASSANNREMTNLQLYLAIGVPMLFNAVLAGILVACINSRLDGVNSKVDSLQASLNGRIDSLNQRLDDLRDLWRAELRRVEEVLDARLKHLEER
jgi:hypothetical protein